MYNILHTEYSKGWGGQEIRILNECLGMKERGHNVFIAAPEKSGIFKKTREKGIKVFDVSFNRFNPFEILKIAALIKKNGINIVNTHSSPDSWLSTFAVKIFRLPVKVIRTRHLSTPISSEFFKRPFEKLIYDILPDAVFTTGESIKERMVKINKFNGQKIFSVPTGADLKKFNPAIVKKAFDSKNFKVITVSVLRPWKGLLTLIHAAPLIIKKIPDIEIHIVGGGQQYYELKDEIKKMDLTSNIFMEGHREDIPEAMAAADIIVHPSNANEGVPQTIVQAYAMGKPVIASDVGSINEVVQDGKTGILISPKNPEILAREIIELYNNAEIRKKYAAAGRKLVEENYSFKNMLEKIERLYAEI